MNTTISYVSDMAHPFEERKVAIVVFCSILTIFGIISNMFTILTILRTKELRVLINVFTAILAFVDFLTLAYILPFHIYTIHNNSNYGNSILLCKVNGFITHLLFTCSVQCIMMISVTRYVKICHPHNFDEVFTPSNVIAVSAYCMLLNVGFATPLTFDAKNIVYDQYLHICIINRHSSRFYSCIYVITCVFLPIMGTTACYLNTYLHIRQNGRNRSEFSGNRQRFRINQDLRSARIQFCAFVMFILLHIPFALTHVFDRGTFPDAFHTTGIYLIFTNAFVNSVLYGICNARIKEQYAGGIGRLFGRILFFRRQTRNTIRINVIPADNSIDDTRVNIY